MEQIDFFRGKLNLPTETWQDIWKGAHDRAFVVAGAMKADLLDDLRQAAAPLQRTTLEAFRKDFRAIVQKNGWHGWTGEGTQAGEAWRTRVIFETNVRTSHAAGRWRQLNDPETARALPYWRYVHNDSVMHPREQHKAWGDMRLTLPRTDAFWQTHFPPNGWGCRCRVVAVRGPAEGDASEPPAGWNKKDDKTGEPVGIDKGWGYAPGANAAKPLRELIDQKLGKLDAGLGAAMWAHLKPALAMETRLAVMDMVDRVAGAMRANGESILLRGIAPGTLDDLAERGIALESAGLWLRDHELLHALRDAKAGTGAALPAESWRDLPRLLETAAPYLDTEDAALVYALDLDDRKGKVLVRINYTEKIHYAGKRKRIIANFVRTAGIVEPHNLEEARYAPLKK